jgi:hypothetical protein
VKDRDPLWRAVDGTFRVMHIIMASVIAAPMLVIAFFPFMTNFQVCPHAVNLLYGSPG